MEGAAVDIYMSKTSSTRSGSPDAIRGAAVPTQTAPGLHPGYWRETWCQAAPRSRMLSLQIWKSYSDQPTYSSTRFSMLSHS